MKKVLFIVTVFLIALVNSSTAQTAIETKTTINITNFHVYAKDSKLIVEWGTEGNKATNYWEVQRSSENLQFSTIAIVLGADPNQPGEKYEYMEKIKDTKGQPVYYRLRYINADGSEQLSNIIQQGKVQ